ncbi:MAG: glycerol-3-phosphate dehydrogenase/oxidase [Acidobacteriota bacterium]|nr:glycerol-3-phosphate dehydrogenase/oxidase [Acidobacteriota bacterium]
MFRSLSAVFDVLVIGGGATGLGIALDAATRGYRTALVEAGDFAQATSSRSTKLVHGGVRYLASGQVHLVREALQERAVMRRNAPHLVHALPTLLPATQAWELLYFGAGLMAYDLLSGSSSMGPTRVVGPRAAVERVPGIATEGLRGGVLYHDAQFNDARFALATARAAIDHGAVAMNYVRCTGFRYKDGGVRVAGAIVEEGETGETGVICASAIINATGIFTDETRTLEQPDRPRLLSVSRGSHIVLPGRFLGGSTALMVPKTEDGRVIFAIPWEGVVLVGTTDIAAAASVMEPGVEPDEIDYLLRHIAPYLKEGVTRGDVLSVFSGLRPLVTGKENRTSKLSREHHIDVSRSGLITVAGGKWTTYRRMAEDTLDAGIRAGLLPRRKCVSRGIALRGCPAWNDDAGPPKDRYLAEYGTDSAAVEAIERAEPELRKTIDPDLPYTGGMVVYAARCEYARTVEDVLSRRTRAVLLDSRAAMRSAPAVAALMARELGREQAWVELQSDAFLRLVRAHYTLESFTEPKG